jgi:hypothetical protein
MNGQIHELEILGTVYKFRPATRKEIKEIINTENPWEAEDSLCSMCVVYPENIDWNNLLAGVANQLANKILEVSGVTEQAISEIRRKSEEWIASTEGKLEALMACILHFTPETIDSMSQEEWQKWATAAQVMSVALYNFPIDNFLATNPIGSKKPNIRNPSHNIPPQARPANTNSVNAVSNHNVEPSRNRYEMEFR